MQIIATTLSPIRLNSPFICSLNNTLRQHDIVRSRIVQGLSGRYKRESCQAFLSSQHPRPLLPSHSRDLSATMRRGLTEPDEPSSKILKIWPNRRVLQTYIYSSDMNNMWAKFEARLDTNETFYANLEAKCWESDRLFHRVGFWYTDGYFYVVR